MKKILVSMAAVAALFVLNIVAIVQFTTPTTYAQTFPTFFARLLAGNDPCMDPMVSKNSIALNVAAATTTQHVAPSGTLTVYVCGWSFTAAGTTPTYQFITGTGATCGTGTVTNTGTYLPIVSALQAVTDTGSVFKTAAGAGVCSVVGGTGPSVQGILTFVQQ